MNTSLLVKLELILQVKGCIKDIFLRSEIIKFATIRLENSWKLFNFKTLFHFVKKWRVLIPLTVNDKSKFILKKLGTVVSIKRRPFRSYIPPSFE